MAKSSIAADGGAAADVVVGEAGSVVGAGSDADAGLGEGAGWRWHRLGQRRG